MPGVRKGNGNKLINKPCKLYCCYFRKFISSTCGRKVTATAVIQSEVDAAYTLYLACISLYRLNHSNLPTVSMICCNLASWSRAAWNHRSNDAAFSASLPASSLLKYIQRSGCLMCHLLLKLQLWRSIFRWKLSGRRHFFGVVETEKKTFQAVWSR